MGDDESKQQALAQFMDITGLPPDKCCPFLEATNWQLEDTVQLFFAGGMDSPSPRGTGINWQNDGLRETSYRHMFEYDRAMRSGFPKKTFRDFEEENELKFKSGVGSSTDASTRTLASMYRPPLGLRFEGTLEEAKAAARKSERWLIVNVQSHTEFASHMLNRDTWSNDAVKDTIRTTFIFWQIYDDTEDGDMVCKYYQIKTLPAILVLHPQSGQKMKSWSGEVDAEQLLEDLLEFMDIAPMEPKRINPFKTKEDEELQKAIAASLSVKASEAESKPRFNCPPLPDEPEVDDEGIWFDA